MFRVGLPALLLLAAGGLRAADPPVQVTTDSIAYCRILADRLAALPEAAEEPARRLGKEGRTLCETGHVRTGIAKLRRALRVAHGER
jgi:hypothetical protein